MMKKFVSVIAICLIAAPVLAATPTAQSRRSMRGQMVMSAPRTVATTDTVAPDVADDSSSDARATASVKQINAIAAANTGVATTDKSSIRVEPTKDSVSEPEEYFCLGIPVQQYCELCHNGRRYRKSRK